MLPPPSPMEQQTKPTQEEEEETIMGGVGIDPESDPMMQTDLSL